MECTAEVRQDRCELCEILLSSSWGGNRSRKYCDGCRKEYGRQIFNVWHRRAYQKRKGKNPDAMICDNILKQGRITDKNRKERIIKYKEMQKSGMSFALIGNEFGVSASAVWKFLKENA